MKSVKQLLCTSILLISATCLLTACQNKSNQAEKPSDVVTEQNITQDNGKGEVTVSEAIDLYQKTYPNSDIIKLELDNSFGKIQYKIEGVDDIKEYTVKVDGETKKVDTEKEEALDTDERDGQKRQQEKIDVTELKSLTEISEIAEKEVGKGQADEWELEQKLGITYWEVTVKNGLKDTSVKINAQTGEVLEVEQED
ncbi:PepSY domain-containing protein [Vagococcus humatus]|uniref:Lysis protein n=1 Tax=Vagococcus humatus TaxID=1889241 RepID=A0A3R9YYE3_9ENTE|nr:PepSY domain-containing protein [Vagococcus humatus]RST90372.1 lysis protein [Vagococcus humatus]